MRSPAEASQSQGQGPSWIPVWIVRPPVIGTAVILLALVGIAAFRYDTLASHAAGMLGIVLVVYVALSRLPVFERRFMLAIACYRFALVAVDVAFAISPQFDSRLYSGEAAHYAYGWHGIEYPKSPNIDGLHILIFVGPLADLFYVFGPSFALGRVFWTALGLIAPYALYCATSRLYPRRFAVLATVAFAVWPSLAQIQTDVLRDNLVIIGLTVAFAAIVGLAKTRRPHYLAGVVVGFGVMVLTRNVNIFAGLPFLGYALVALRSAIARIAVTVMGATATTVIAVMPTVRARFLLLGSTVHPAYFEVFRRAFSVSNQPYLADVRFSSWADVLLFLPLGLVFFLFVPFPWQWHNPLSFALALENLVYYYPMVVLGLIGAQVFWKTEGHRERMFALLVLVVMGAAFGLLEANVGSAMRHRHQFSWAWIVLLPAGLMWLWPRLQRVSDQWKPSIRGPLVAVERWLTGGPDSGSGQLARGAAT